MHLPQPWCFSYSPSPSQLYFNPLSTDLLLFLSFSWHVTPHWEPPTISTTWRETCLIISLMLHCWHGRTHWHCLNIFSFLSKLLVDGSSRFWFHGSYIRAPLILLLIFYCCVKPNKDIPHMHCLISILAWDLSYVISSHTPFSKSCTQIVFTVSLVVCAWGNL